MDARPRTNRKEKPRATQKLDPGPHGNTNVSARDDLESLRSQYAVLEVSAPSTHYSVVDLRIDPMGEKVINEYGPFDGPVRLRVKPGKHQVFAEGDKLVASSWTAIATYAALGVSVAAAGTSLGMYARGNSLENEEDARFLAECPNGANAEVPGCEPTTSGDSRAAAWHTGSAVAAGISGAALVTALVIWLGSGDDDASAPNATVVAPWIGREGFGAHAQIRF